MELLSGILFESREGAGVVGGSWDLSQGQQFHPPRYNFSPVSQRIFGIPNLVYQVWYTKSSAGFINIFGRLNSSVTVPFYLSRTAPPPPFASLLQEETHTPRTPLYIPPPHHTPHTFNPLLQRKHCE